MGINITGPKKSKKAKNLLQIDCFTYYTKEHYINKCLKKKIKNKVEL